MSNERATVAGLMELVSEFGQCRWSEGSSGATYLDRAGERRSREEAAELYKEIEAYAARLHAGVRGCDEAHLLACPESITPRPLNYTLTDYHRAPYDGPLNYTWKDKPHRLIYDLVAALAHYTNAGVGVLPGQPKRVGWFVFIDGEWKQSTKYAESALPLYELPDGVPVLPGQQQEGDRGS